MRIIILTLLLVACVSPVLAQDDPVPDANAFNPIGFYNLGNAYAHRGDNEAAIAAYRKAIEQRHGHYSRALNNLGVVLLRLDRWD